MAMAPNAEDKILVKKNFIQEDTATISDASMATSSADLSLKMAGMSLDSTTQHQPAGSSIGSAMSTEEAKGGDDMIDPVTGEPYIRGNKQLSVEVKLSDIVIAGSLGAGA